MRKSEALLVAGMLLAGSLAQAIETSVVRVASPQGMQLREAPSMTARVIKAIDASYLHKFEPCVDCGETSECPRGFRQEGRECFREGHLYRYRNFIWAREIDEYFFLNEKGDMCSVYSSEADGIYCATAL